MQQDYKTHNLQIHSFSWKYLWNTYYGSGIGPYLTTKEPWFHQPHSRRDKLKPDLSVSCSSTLGSRLQLFWFFFFFALASWTSHFLLFPPYLSSLSSPPSSTYYFFLCATMKCWCLIWVLLIVIAFPSMLTSSPILCCEVQAERHYKT